MEKLEALEARLGYTFKDKKLLLRALTHRSYAQEHNERLEFLGDSVLNFVIGYALFLRDRHFTEGKLSRVRSNLVCEKTLADLAETIPIGQYIRLGEGEKRSGGLHRPSIMADSMEALFGAVFIDGGFEAAQDVIMRLYCPTLTTLTPENLSKDAKTMLQEYLQSLHLERPQYRIVNISGASHAQTFESECVISELGIVTQGQSTNRRGAEQAAAKLALERFKTHPLAKKNGFGGCGSEPPKNNQS